MKRLFLMSLMSLFTLQTALADCRTTINDHLSLTQKKFNRTSEVMLVPWVTSVVVFGPVGIIVAGASGASLASGYGISQAKHKRLLKLINDSINYVELNGNGIPGKTLNKFFKKIQSDKPELTMLELASAINEANSNLSLCNQDIMFIKDLKKHYANEDIIVIE